MKSRHSITSTTDKNGTIVFDSKTNKNFTEDECEALLIAHRKHKGDWNLIAIDVKQRPDACPKKYTELKGKKQCTSVQQFRHLPEDIHNILSNTLTDGENKNEVLIHVNYIGQDNMIEMTEDMIGDFIDRFATEYKRQPSKAAMKYMKSLVGEKPLLPDTVVHFLACHLAHNTVPQSNES